MSQPENQGQHIIPQVYLRQFGYEENGKWWVSVCKIGTITIQNVLIEKFTQEINIFDLPFKHFEDRRLFESTSSKIETVYHKIINNLIHQKRSTPKNRSDIANFVANLMVRSNQYREFLSRYIRIPETRKNLIEEICMYFEDEEKVTEALRRLPIDLQITPFMIFVVSHITEVLQRFEQVVLYSPRGWITTDNPVCYDLNGNTEWLIPLQTEIYFPLSKNYCVFMYHINSGIQTNPLSGLNCNQIHTIDIETFELITKKIVSNACGHLIFPIKMDDQNVGFS